MILRAAIFLGFAGLFLVLANTRIWSGPYYYDEADYIFAARMGFGANYTDSPTMPIGEFVRTGLDRNKSPEKTAALSEAIRNSNDIVFYRHWHGPMHVYFLSLISSVSTNERLTRHLSMAFPLLTLMAIYFGCLWLTPGREGLLQAMLASALFLWSGPAAAATELAPHQLFAACSIASLILLAKSITSGRRVYFLGSAIAAGLAFATMEVAFVLVAVLLAVLILEKKRWLWQGVASFLLTVLIAWPGALLKLSFLKAYFFMAYLAVFRHAAWGDKTTAQIWTQRFAQSPLEWVLIALAVAVFLAGKMYRTKRLVYPFLVFGILMLGATLRVNSESPRYMLPFLPALDLFAGCVLAAWLAKRPPWIGYSCVALAGIISFGLTWPRLAHEPANPDPRPAAVLEFIRNNRLDGRTLLVPQEDLPMIHGYFPSTHLRGYAAASPTPEELSLGPTDGILSKTYPVLYRPARE